MVLWLWVHLGSGFVQEEFKGLGVHVGAFISGTLKYSCNTGPQGIVVSIIHGFSIIWVWGQIYVGLESEPEEPHYSTRKSKRHLPKAHIGKRFQGQGFWGGGA